MAPHKIPDSAARRTDLRPSGSAPSNVGVWAGMITGRRLERARRTSGIDATPSPSQLSAKRPKELWGTGPTTRRIFRRFHNTGIDFRRMRSDTSGTHVKGSG